MDINNAFLTPLDPTKHISWNYGRANL